MSPEEIIAYLEKHGRSTVKDIGTDNATMYALEKAGAVQKDGSIRIEGAGRGRPPTAWIVANGEAASEVTAPGTKGRGTPEHIQKMQEGRRKAAEARVKEEKKKKKQQLKELKSELPGAEKKYEASLKACRKATSEEEIKAAFDKSDIHQNTVIRSLRQIRILEAELV